MIEENDLTPSEIKRRAWYRAYYAKNRDKFRLKNNVLCKRYYAKNKEKILKQQKIYRYLRELELSGVRRLKP